MRTRISTDFRRITFTVSRRNLRTMLTKLDEPESARTLVSRDVWLDETLADDIVVVLHAEDDNLHYVDRPPGAVHPATEAAMLLAELGTGGRVNGQSLGEPGDDHRAASSATGSTDRNVDEHRPGVRPNSYEAGLLHGWVFDQHQVWVDVHGTEHEIESMPIAYVQNVIGFCERQAGRIRMIVDLSEAASVLELALALIDEARWQRQLRVMSERHNVDALQWLRGTPLFAALYRRLEAAHGE